MECPLIEIRNLTFTYPEQRNPALDGVSLTVGRGEFVVLCGPSGCGKSTLLRHLKPVLAPHGERTGEILYQGRPLESLDRREQSTAAGFVGQDPESQTVTDKVWHEMAFGLESLGFPTPVIRRRVAEMASFFGMQSWFYRSTSELSGGQKQLLNLASVMVMQPQILVLDEPAGQLDPVAASEFFSMLGRISRELGTAVILAEHRLEEALPLADRAAVMEEGRILCTGTPAETGDCLRKQGHGMFLAMPAPMRVWAASDTEGTACPVTVREGREWIGEFARTHVLKSLPEEHVPACPDPSVLSCRELHFRWEGGERDAVNGLTLTLHRGEFLALLGGNGAGKTTALRLFAGLKHPDRGELEVRGRVCLLPQDPKTLFVKRTLREDLLTAAAGTEEEREEKTAGAVSLCRLEHLLDRHPYDLSGGEQQRAALARMLLLDPDILLLDEPTKGLDAQFKETFAGILGKLQGQGVSILMVSHDVEFCARHAGRCALLFDGAVTAEGTPREFFSGNSFYTTSVSRMCRETVPLAVTVEDAVFCCGGSLPPAEEEKEPEEAALPPPEPGTAAWRPPPLPLWRRVLAVLSGAAALGIFFQAARITDLSQLTGPAGLSGAAQGQLQLYAAFLAALVILAMATWRRNPARERTVREKRKLSPRTAAAAVFILLLVPLTLYLGAHVLKGRKYYFIALLILLETMIPFFLVFEGRKPGSRELAVTAVLCAMGTAGRAVFFMFQQCKPVMAVCILAGVEFGGETGFLVGAVTMLLSNILFSQGPWTPWQMFAMGIIGFLAGVLYRWGLLGRSRVSLCIFGALSAVLLYGGIMNPASVLIWAGELNWQTLAASYVTGFPFDCVQAAATALFLWFGAEPVLEKLDRVKVKYGLMDF